MKRTLITVVALLAFTCASPAAPTVFLDDFQDDTIVANRMITMAIVEDDASG